eukprot:CAMPEP_0170527074 /NCGR_PEP_ID=MMETSP0209-20121228/12513_1 /TAXON_ID=665100 ORGANISM="Litonotus pictus, Strain P1" /NCGR_SAMPLE_ID=MMETSP0209 /ASSEMBLY_ACC=CAM_ASM_000301 /LENGTH=180 /DNA_ID=CAMNT_0010817329 /DNA_START=226 /DNA_END=764 /DNA_ORIENTATION=-
MQESLFSRLSSIELILNVPNSDSKIDAQFIQNNSQVNITLNKIIRLNNATGVLYDCQLEKINYFKNSFKYVTRYFQITKYDLKYFNSVFSSSVWNDKPLMKLPIKNIKEIRVSPNSEYILSKARSKMVVIIEVEVLIDEEFSQDMLDEVSKANLSGKGCVSVIGKNTLLFGSENEEIGIS